MLKAILAALVSLAVIAPQFAVANTKTDREHSEHSKKRSDNARESSRR